jgi:hypothetical protein
MRRKIYHSPTILPVWREGVMSSLAFRCRRTRQHVDSGIEADNDGAPKLAVSAFRLRCPVCEERHVWLISEGRIIQTTIGRAEETVLDRLTRLRDRLSAA